MPRCIVCDHSDTTPASPYKEGLATKHSNTFYTFVDPLTGKEYTYCMECLNEDNDEI